MAHAATAAIWHNANGTLLIIYPGEMAFDGVVRTQTIACHEPGLHEGPQSLRCQLPYTRQQG